MITKAFLKRVDAGRNGDNWGLSMGMPKLEQWIDGVSPSTYTLLFAGSGVGKTSFGLYSYIFRPLMDCPDDDFRVIYYSLEMSADILFGKLLGMYIFEKYGLEISVKEMLSRRRGFVLSDDYYQIILEATEWLESIEKRVLIYDKALNADILRSHLNEQMKKYGTFEETEDRIIYHQNNPKQVILVVLDHAGLLRATAGRSQKAEIDLASSILVTYRNRCFISPLVLAQMNRDASSMDRRKAGFEEPQRSDIKDTGNMEQDSDVIIALFDPTREKLSNYRNYSVEQLSRILRGVLLLKNRYGDGDIFIGGAFYGKCGIWRELPKPEEIIDYTRFQTVNWTNDNQIADVPKKDEEEVKTDKLKITFTL